jgi:hypothetical protein
MPSSFKRPFRIFHNQLKVLKYSAPPPGIMRLFLGLTQHDAERLPKQHEAARSWHQQEIADDPC